MTSTPDSRGGTGSRTGARPSAGTSSHPDPTAIVMPVESLAALSLKVYLSGPMTGIPGFNYEYFNRVKNWLRTRGVPAVSPTDVDGGQQVTDYSTKKPYGYYLTEALKLQLTADAWMGLPGWTKSKGAKREFDIALDLGHRTFLWREDERTSMFWIEEIL